MTNHMNEIARRGRKKPTISSFTTIFMASLALMAFFSPNVTAKRFDCHMFCKETDFTVSIGGCRCTFTLFHSKRGARDHGKDFTKLLPKKYFDDLNEITIEELFEPEMLNENPNRLPGYSNSVAENSDRFVGQTILPETPTKYFPEYSKTFAENSRNFVGKTFVETPEFSSYPETAFENNKILYKKLRTSQDKKSQESFYERTHLPSAMNPRVFRLKTLVEEASRGSQPKRFENEQLMNKRMNLVKNTEMRDMAKKRMLEEVNTFINNGKKQKFRLAY